VDDDASSRKGLAALLAGWGYATEEAGDGVQALDKARTLLPSVVITDLVMPKRDGLALLSALREELPFASVILLTGQGSIDTAVTALKEGAYDFLTKPVDLARLKMLVPKAVERAEGVREVQLLRRRVKQVWGVGKLVGNSTVMQGVYRLIELAAPTTAPVLVTGESGTGKELVARAIHAASPRRDRLFVAVNCAALSEGVLESELFGHKRGAFTGALEDRKGLFEVATGGTLFLDEISETTAGVQAKLLRVLQEGEIRPVGETRSRTVDVRTIVATNRDLADEVKAGRFREDLYYRLRVFPIRVPPLRERTDDIPALTVHFLRKLAAQLKRPVLEATDDVFAFLARYPFPGNVRELANELERAVLLAEPGAPLTEDLLSERLQDAVADGPSGGVLQHRTDAFEREQIEAALARAGGVKTRVAEELGITYRGLLKKMKRLGM